MNDSQLCVFSKALMGPTLAETARRLRAMGISALDLTVRPGGHVEPERVRDDLPRVAAELAGEGVRIAQITTNITDVSDKDTLPILQTAAGLGISLYKLGYYPYEGFGSLRRQRTEIAGRLKEIAALNQEIGIQAGFHNHSGGFVGASLWDIDVVLSDIAPGAIGLYLDPAHATIEGGSRGWEMGIDLLKDRIVMLAVKDFIWVENNGPENGGRRRGLQWLPLQQGNVRWPPVLRFLNAQNYSGPISLHSEYQNKNSGRTLTTDEVFDQTGRDAAQFREWMQAAQTDAKA